MTKQKILLLVSLFSLLFRGIDAEEVYEIPFIVNEKGQILVHAHINGYAEPKVFLLSTINRSVIRADKRPELFKMKIDTNAVKLRLKSLSFPCNFAFQDIKMDWKTLGRREHEQYGQHIFGIIGPSILRHYVCQLNFKTMRLKLTKNIDHLNISDSTLSTFFSSSFLNWYPSFEVSIQKIGKTAVYLDINSLLHINLPKENFEVKSETTKLVYINDNSEEAITSGIMENVTINEMEFSKAPISLSSELPAVIGLGFLKDYIVTIDFLDKKLYLQPNKIVNK